MSSRILRLAQTVNNSCDIDVSTVRAQSVATRDLLLGVATIFYSLCDTRLQSLKTIIFVSVGYRPTLENLSIYSGSSIDLIISPYQLNQFPSKVHVSVWFGLTSELMTLCQGQQKKLYYGAK